MGMPITIEIRDEDNPLAFETVFDYFRSVDARFSPFKSDSELSQINRGLPKEKWSDEMKEVMELCDQTREITGGYFDIHYEGNIDTSGLVKGWAIDKAAMMLKDLGYNIFFIEAGGDIQVEGDQWEVGIRNPFDVNEIVKVISISGKGVATSGAYIRGDHIYNPIRKSTPIGVSSITVVASDIFEADRFATAAYAMGSAGINFINALPEVEGYMIDGSGLATFTKGFANYVA